MSELDWRSGTPPGHQAAATPEGSPSCHILPSQPPSPPPLEAPSCYPRLELRALPCMLMVNAMEVELSSSLVTMVRGSRPPVSLAQVLDYLALHFQVSIETFWVYCSCPDNFIVIFNDVAVADGVLYAQNPPIDCLSLVFWRWRQQLCALFSVL
jgi:hypothetical protein